MGRRDASQPDDDRAESGPAGRLASAERRASLLDAAAELIAAGELDGVSMESVADRAGVSRALVYKHFTNRRDLLAALYQREVAQVHERMAAQVGGADSVVEMYRELIRTTLDAARKRYAVFAALHAAGVLTREDQRRRRLTHEQTVTAFAARAVREYGVSEPLARAASTLLLAALTTAVTQWFQRPTDDNAALIEQAYLGLVHGGLALLATQTANAPRPEPGADRAGSRRRRLTSSSEQS
jgi:AcrR family transcriptional regulator